ncbi:MAG: ZrgA family zinc uptake protein [Geminicoccales bacterium]
MIQKLTQIAMASFFFGALNWSTSIQAEQREADGHIHGLTFLNLVVEGKAVLAELEAPGADIVGFEHPAETDDQMKQVKAALERLKSGDAVLTFEASAKCTLNSSNTELHGDSLSADHDHTHDDHEDSDHAAHNESETENHTEFRATYQWTCPEINEKTAISFPFFTSFPNSLKLRVNHAGDFGQGSAIISKGASELKFGELSG